jgi:hypothetical protein
MPESYSFTPQFATIRSESPLAGMRPVKAVHTALQFQPQKFLEVKSEQPELVSNAWASGLKEGIGDALKGITTAYVDERKAKAEKTEKEAERRNRVLVAKYRGKGTEDEEFQKEYKAAQLENLKSLVEERKKKKEDDDEEVDYGSLDEPTSMDATEVPEDNLPENEMWNLGFPEETEDVLNPLSSLVPTQLDVQALLSKPLSALTANVDIQNQAGTLADMQAGNLTPTGASMSTDTQAPEKPASFNILSKNKSLVSPEEARRIQEEFYATTRELPTGFDALSTLPKPEQQQVLSEQKVDEQDLNRYFKTWGDPNVAIKAQKKIAEILGPEYNEAKIEQIKTKKGETGFKVLFPERKTDEELKKQKDSGEIKKEKLQQFQLQSFENVNRAQETLADLEQQLEKVQNKLGPISGRVLAKNPYDSDVQILQKYLTALVPTIARGVYGEVGVLTEADVNNYKQLIPNITQDPANAKATLEFLKRDLQRAKKNKLNIWEATNFDIQGLKKFITPESGSENLANLTKQKFMQMKEMPEGEEKEQLKKELKVLVEQLRATQKK